jgi:tetratricopeptide (TPR) repeat protein
MPRILIVRAMQRALLVCALLGLCALGIWMAILHVLAEYHLRQAQHALTRQRYRLALTELQQALRFRPRSGELHLLTGRTARQCGNKTLAWDHLHRCRELDKGVTAELQLEEFLLRAQSGELDQVYPYLAAYLFQEGPQTPLVLESLSHVYLYTYQFDRAWMSLQRWLTLQPDNVAALFLRGTYYSMNSKPELAVEDLRRTLDLDPHHLPARLLLAQTLKERSRTEKAAVEYQIVLQQEPSNFTARVGLAWNFVDRKEWTKARPLLEELYLEKPDHAEVLHLKGRLAEADGRFDEAVHLLKASLAANPADNSSCYHLMLCCRRKGDDPAADEYQDRLDRIERDQKRLLDITSKQMEQLASDPALCCELGEVCLRLGVRQRGLHWLHTALRLDPRYRPAHEQLLHYYEQLGPDGEKDAAFHRQQLPRSDQTKEPRRAATLPQP